MTFLRKMTMLAAACIVAPAIAAGSAAADATRVVFVTHGQAADQYWSVVKHGMDDAAKTLGVNAEYLAPETFDMPAMQKLLDAAIASKPDGLVVSIPDENAIGPLVESAVKSGIPVIVVDSGGSELSRKLGALLYMGQSEYDAGVAAGQKVKALGLSKAVCVNHEVGNVSLDDRCRGFGDGLGAEVPVLQGVMDPTEMKGRIAAHLQQNPDTQFVLTVGSAGADPALAAIEEAGLTGKIKTGTFDLSPTILQAVVDGKMEWGIDAQQYLMGYIPVVAFDLMKRYKLAPIADYPTGPGFVGKAEAGSVIELAKQGVR
ncbi:MAG: sugar ABC transporter substrate-binding protein [Rhodospirillaceae bacterium]|nr:sugar ABC transporter substrate-binding protein [Rhodospirillaceae bacterium]